MDTSVTFTELAITALMNISLTLAFRTIAQIKKQFSQNGHYNFDSTKTQNRKIISIDKKQRLLFIDFSYKEKESIYFMNLKDTLLFNTLVTTENNLDTIKKQQ